MTVTNKKNIIVKITNKPYELKFAKKASKYGFGPKVIKSTKKCGKTLIYMRKASIILYEWLQKKHSKKVYNKTYDSIVKLIQKMHNYNIVHGDIHIGNIGLFKKKWLLIDYGKSHYKNKSFKLLDTILKIVKLPSYSSNKGYDKYFKNSLTTYNKIPFYIKTQHFLFKTLKSYF